MLIGLVTFNRVPLDVNPQITGRTAPTMLDLGVAVTIGVAGSFALVRRDIVNILAGVAIAISLVPVLAVVGITLGSGRLDLAWGALILFLTNAAAIIVAGVVVFTAAGYQRDAAARGARIGRRAVVFITVFVIALVIPLGLSSLRTYRHERWVNATRTAAEHWVRRHRLARRGRPGGERRHRRQRHRFGPQAASRTAACRREEDGAPRRDR